MTGLIILLIILLIIILPLWVFYTCKLYKTRRNSTRIPRETYIKNPSVYLTMTTIPERLKDDFFYKLLKHTLQLCGSHNNAKLIINVPNVYKKTGKTYGSLNRLKRLQKKHKNILIINRCEDEGPITKILPTLRLDMIKPNDLILVCDDDLWYREYFINRLVDAYNLDKEAVHCYCAQTIQGFAGYIASKKGARRFNQIFDAPLMFYSGRYCNRSNIKKIKYSNSGCSI